MLIEGADVSSLSHFDLIWNSMRCHGPHLGDFSMLQINFSGIALTDKEVHFYGDSKSRSVDNEVNDDGICLRLCIPQGSNGECLTTTLCWSAASKPQKRSVNT